MSRAATLITSLLLTAIAGAAQSAKIDPQRSTMTVKVGKSGLFSAFGHNHTIRAPIAAGNITTSGARAVELTVDARRMQVLDPDVDAKERAEVQKTMHSAAVLDSERFPQIQFVSRSIEAAGGNRYRVSGELTLHGVKRPVVVRVEGREGRYTGSATVKQTEFGIKPITAGGGTVKVKDTVEIVFEIVAQSSAQSELKSIARSPDRQITRCCQSPTAAGLGVESSAASVRSSPTTATPSR